MNDTPDPPYSQEDLDEVMDNPEITEEEFAKATWGPAGSGLPEGIVLGLEELARRQREAREVLVSLGVDNDVLEAYKATGPGWQGRMNAALRKGLEKPAETSTEETGTEAA